MEKIRPFDTIEGQTNSSEINKYAKVFSNGSFFTEIYPMAIKADAGIALKNSSQILESLNDSPLIVLRSRTQLE